MGNNEHLSSEEIRLNKLIHNESPLYFYRYTPFTEHSEFNYNGTLTPKFFFKHLFCKAGEWSSYFDEIKGSLENRRHKCIVLTGNQGCGKTTFIHGLEEELNKDDHNNYNFVFLDFDQDTSNPTISEYIELLSSYLLKLMQSDQSTNAMLLDLYERNHNLITDKINANNNIENFISKFKKIFVLKKCNRNAENNFIKEINLLYFNQILSLITLWHICQYKVHKNAGDNLTPIVFCLDNLDVLVNKDIIELFFKDYFRFVRNIDSIIQGINDEFIKNHIVSYNNLFTFILGCRQHTWARVKQEYIHQRAFITVSTLIRDITDAFDKKEILSLRDSYIQKSFTEDKKYCDLSFSIRQIIADMDTSEGQGHNIYDLFDDDYRQCNLTIESILEGNPDIISEYNEIKKASENKYMNGARGIIYKELFDKFKNEGIFDQIGVLDLDYSTPLVSNARMILNYLNDKTYTKNKRCQKYVTFNRMVQDFKGIIDQDTLNTSIIAMFKLGYNSYWNELVAFNLIDNEEITINSSTEIFITQAGHEYLDLIATHFEFFNARVVKKRTCNCALFAPKGLQKCESINYEYNFQEVIQNVYDIVDRCCEKMSIYYDSVMKSKFGSISQYLASPFVYSDAMVLHSERILHTHIRYIDQYRLYVLNNSCNCELSTKIKINKILVDYIKEYINIGEKYPNITTSKSTEVLFPIFLDKIATIVNSGYTDFSTKIDIK